MKKRIIIVISIIIISSLAYVIYDRLLFSGTYATPEEAIMKQRDVKVKEIITILEDGDYAVGIFKYDSKEASRYLYKSEKGWKIIYSNVFFYQYVKHINGYILCKYKHNGNYLIYIDRIDESTDNVVAPFDNVNSDFKFSSYTKEFCTISSWFVVLDRLPENYEITLDGETINIR